MHGHRFQVIARAPGLYSGNDHYPAQPVRRDTVVLAPNGHTVWRFQANNPGVWLLHCHMEWHVAAGLTVTLVEDPLSIQQNQKIPQDGYQLCQAQPGKYMTQGNAVGATSGNVSDTTGSNSANVTTGDGNDNATYAQGG